MSRWRWLLAIFTGCLCIVASQSVFAFRCGTDLVREGDSKLSVLDKCGEPALIDRWPEEIVDFPDTDFERRVSRINERWIYNFGPSQFLRIITFKDGDVFSIENGSRGFTVSPGMQRCNFDILSLEITTIELQAKCGEPDSREQRYEMVTTKIPGGRRQVTVAVDKWTFNLGPTQFMRILTFHNGKLIEIRTGEKGFR